MTTLPVIATPPPIIVPLFVHPLALAPAQPPIGHCPSPLARARSAP